MRLRSIQSLAAALALVAFAACDNSSPPPDPAAPDATAETSVSPDTEQEDVDGVEPDAVTPDASDVSVPGEPSLSVQLVLAEGAVSPVNGEYDLFPENEPSTYAATDGFQIDLSVALRGLEGRTLTLNVNGENIATAKAEGSPAVATFKAVTLPNSPVAQTLIFRATTEAGVVVASTVAVNVDIVPCVLELSGVEANGCLAPGDTSVTIWRTAGRCESAGLIATIDGTETSFEAKTFSVQGKATFIVPMAADQDVPVVFAASATHSKSPALTATTELSARYDDRAPVLAFLKPDIAVTPALKLVHDEDLMTAGLQYAVAGTVSGLDPVLGGEITLVVAPEGAAPTTIKTMATGGTFAFDALTFDTNGPVTLTLSAVDTCNNSGALPIAWTVYATSPALSILAPGTGSTLLAKDDGNPSTATTFERAFMFQVSGLSIGDRLQVGCRTAGSDASWSIAGTRTIADGDISASGTISVDAALDIGALGTAIECEGIALSANAGMSAPVSLTVALPAPTLSVTAPASGAKLTSRQLVLSGQATGLDGQSLTVMLTNAAGINKVFSTVFSANGTVADGLFSAVVSLDTAITDGTWTLSVDATDGFGNVVSDNTPSAPVTFALDTVAPSVARIAPAVELFDPALVAAHQDVDAESPGFQQPVTAELTGEADPSGGSLCLALGSASPDCQPVDAAGHATWPAVTFAPGAQDVTISGSDAFGNAATPETRSVALELDAPDVAMVSPEAAGLIAASSVDVVVKVTKHDIVAGIPHAAVVLWIDGAASDHPVVHEGEGVYRFAAVPLSIDGPTDLQVTASFSGVTGASLTRALTAKTVQPTIAFNDITDGASIIVGNSSCLGSLADCIRSVHVDLTNAEADSPVVLNVTCDGTLVSYERAVESGGDASASEVTFASVTLAHGTTCVLVANITDLAGQEAATDPASVSIDRVAPVLGAVSPNPAVAVLWDTDTDAETAGLQRDISIVVSGVDANENATLTLLWTDESGAPASASFEASLAATIADDAEGPLVFEGVPFPGGDVSASIAVRDAAGNTSATSAQWTVQGAPAAVAFVGLVWNEVACGSEVACTQGICVDAQCVAPWGIDAEKSVIIAVSGLLTDADNLRICSDHASLSASGAAPCADAGSWVIANASTDGSDTTFDLSGAPQGVQTFHAEIRWQDGSPWSSSAAGANGIRPVLLDLEAPQVLSIAAPFGVSMVDGLPHIDRSFDADANVANGIQVTVGGTAGGLNTDEGDSIKLVLGGVASGEWTGSGGSGTFQVAGVTFEDDGVATVTAIATDRAGNTASFTAEWGVAASIAELAIKSPATSSTLYAKDDIDPLTTTIYEAIAEVALIGAEDGMTVSVECSGEGAPSVSVGHIDISADTPNPVSIEVAIDVAQLGAPVSCVAVARGVNIATSVPFAWVAAIPAPKLSLSAPANGAFLTRHAVTIVGTAEGLDGQALEVSLTNDAGTATFTTESVIAGGAFAMPLDLAVLGGAGEGSYAISINAVDGWGNSVADTQAAPSASVVFDTVAPQVVLTAPATTTLDPANDPSVLDTMPGQPGYQSALTFQVTDAHLEGARLCISLASSDLGCQDLDASGAISWAGVTFVPGENIVAVSGQDGFGNAIEPFDIALNVVLSDALVVITSPAATHWTTESTVAIGVHAASSTGSDLEGANLSLFVDGTNTGAIATEQGDGDYLFSGVALPADTQVAIQVSATGGGQVGTSGERLITYKSTAPSVAFTAPSADSIFNVGHASCVEGLTDCQTTIALGLSNIEPGSALTVTVDCGDGAEAFPMAADSESPSVEVTLAHGAECALSASVTDLAGQEAAAGPIAIAIDRVAPVVAHQAPVEGSLVVAYDDADSATEGLQYAVRADVGGVAAGTLVTADLSWTDASGVAQTTSWTAISGDIAEGSIATVSFEEVAGSGVVTLPDGDMTIEFAVSDAAGNSATASASWQVHETMPSVGFISPTAPNPAACSDSVACAAGPCIAGACQTVWGAANAPEFSVAIAGALTEGNNTRLCSDHPAFEGSGADACETDGFFLVALGGGSDGTAVLSAGAAPQGAQTFIAELQWRADGPWVASTANVDSAAQSRPTLIDIVPPSVLSIAAPQGVNGEGTPILRLADDSDGDDSNGIQFDVKGTVAGLGDWPTESVTLTRSDSGATWTDIPVDGNFAFESVDFTTDGGVTLTVTANDIAGNTHIMQAIWSVVPSRPTAEISGPIGGSVLFAKDDSSAATPRIFDTAFSVAVAGATSGDMVSIECAAAEDAGAWSTVGSASAVDGAVSVTVALDIDALSTDVICRPQVASVNPGTGAPVAMTVALPAPMLAVSKPIDGIVALTTSLDFIASATGLSGQPLKVTVRNEAGTELVSFDALTVSEGGLASGAVDIAGFGVAIPDGVYSLAIDAVDAWGNIASDTADAITRTVRFDTTAPSVALTAPADGTLDPLANAADADSQPGIPGAQRDLVATISGETVLEGAELCASIGGASLGCKAVDSTGTATWSDVTWSGGTQMVVITGHDAAGHDASASSVAVTAYLDAPTVTIETPAADMITASGTIEMVIAVTHPTTGAPVLDANVTASVDGSGSGGAAVNTTPGRYQVSGVALVATQAAALRGLASKGGLSGISAPRSATYKTATPSVEFVNHADGSVLNLASALCAGSAEDCATTVVVGLTDVEDDSSVTITASCGAEPVSYEAIAASNAATATGVTLPHGATCVLSASVVDAAGQSASAPAISVAVDRRGPAFGAFTPVAGTTLIYLDDIDAGTPGMQRNMKVAVSELEAGSVVTATAVWEDPDEGPQTKSWSHIMASDVSATQNYTAVFEDTAGSGIATWPEGDLTVTVSTVDAAGNPGQTVGTFKVQSHAPNVIITSPSYVAAAACDALTDPCTDGACIDSVCRDTWSASDAHQLILFVAGLVTSSDNVRICSDHTSFVGGDATPCGDGFVEVGRADATGGLVAVALPDLPDGTQSLIAQIQWKDGEPWLSSDISANSASTRSRTLFIDTEAPTVSTIGCPDDTAPLGQLNLAESASGDDAFVVQAQGSETGTAVFYINGVAGDILPVDGSGKVSVSATMKQGANAIWVRFFDRAGNPSIAPPESGVVNYAPTVDTIAPVLAFTAPAAAVLNGASNLDIAIAGDEEGLSVILSDNGSDKGTVVVISGVASFPHTTFGVLSDGPHILTARTADAAGNPATAATTPTSISVDATPPTGSITAPADAAVFTDEQDGDAATGYQMDFAFTTGSGAASWSLATQKGCASDYTGCGSASAVASGSVTNADGAEPTETVTMDPDAGFTYQVVTLTVTDAAGNTATHSVHLSFQIVNCTVTLTGLPSGDWINAADCSGSDAGTCDLSLTATVAGVGCEDVDRITIEDGGADWLESMSIASGVGTFATSVSDADVLALTVRAFAGAVEVAANGPYDRTVDVTAPSVTVAPVVVGSPETAGTYGAANDQSSGASGFQFDMAVTVGDADPTGTEVTSVTVAVDGGQASALSPAGQSLPVTTASGSTTLGAFTLADLSSSEVAVTVTDAAGNSASASATLIVDMVAPEGVVLTAPTDIDVRRPSATLHWTAVADNGGTAAAATTVVRYSRQPILTDADFEAACDTNGIVHTDAPSAPTQAGSAESMVIQGPDPRNASDPCKWAGRAEWDLGGTTQYVAVRVKDAAGNLSPMTADATQAIDFTAYHMTLISFDPSVFGDYLTAAGSLVGDVDGDGRADIATGFQYSGQRCIVRTPGYGADEVTISTLTGPNHSCINGVPTGLSGAFFFGAHFMPLGDVNADGFADFGVGGDIPDVTDGAITTRFVAVYLGRDGALPNLNAPEVVIRGIRPSNPAAYYGGFASAGNFNGDFATNGSALSDIAVGESASSVSRIHVIPGQEAWAPDQAMVTIDVSIPADLTANGVLSITSTIPDNPEFGMRAESAGNILPTPGGSEVDCDDLIVYQSGNADSRVFVIPGRIWTGASTGTLTDLSGSATAEDAISVRLRQEITSVASGFGSTIVGGRDFNGDGVPDVVVGHSATSVAPGGLYIFDGASMAGQVGGDVRIGLDGTNSGDTLHGANGVVVESSLFGDRRCVTTIGDWDGWAPNDGAPTNDLLVMHSDQTSFTSRLSHETDDGVWALGDFGVSDAVFSAPAGATGFWIDGGEDLTDDGRPDIVMGTLGRTLVVFW